jgi:peroxiredoxin Q/BCP
MQLEPGDRAPDFTRADHDGNEVSLGDFTGSKLVIYFYPKAFTAGCTTESCDFRDNYQVFRNAGWEVVGVSPDPVGKLSEFKDESDLPFPLLSDEDHSMADAYGAWGLKMNYGKEYEGIIRSTILVDEDGGVAEAFYNVTATGHAERVMSSIS